MSYYTGQLLDEEFSVVDTEYREAVASAFMSLGYLSNSPLMLTMSRDQSKRDEYKRVYIDTPLEDNQLIDVMNYMDSHMKGDFQYSQFKKIKNRILDSIQQTEIVEPDSIFNELIDDGIDM